ncbi:MAG: hypothetical protein ACFFCZ_19635 [Promethearchaeota archaeon]
MGLEKRLLLDYEEHTQMPFEDGLKEIDFVLVHLELGGLEGTKCFLHHLNEKYHLQIKV